MTVPPEKLTSFALLNIPWLMLVAVPPVAVSVPPETVTLPLPETKTPLL